MTWVKICGMTNVEDALVAVEAGADAVGFLFYEKSPRCVTVEAAREIVAKLPTRIEKVGVFVNQQEDIICSAIEQAGITAVQMHGDDEDPHVADLIVKCRAGVKIFPAISMRQPNPGGRAMRWNLNSIRAFLLDSGSSSKYGGTGQPFDWKASIPVTNQIKVLRNVVLAGGLTPRNVVDAINILQPWGVDVASGVEARPGKKDPEKVQAFLRVVREFDRKVS